MIYVIIGIIIMIFSYFEGILKSRRFSDFSLFGIGLGLVLFAGVRYHVGTDWDAYFDIYKQKTDRVEIGYSILNNIFSDLDLPYNFFLLFINGISITLMSVFLRKHASFMIIGVLIFYSDLFLYFNLSGIRQALAISITCFSIRYALNGNFWKFLIMILLACCFHLSAIIFVLAYFIPKKALQIRHLIVIIVIFVLITFLLDSIADLISLYTIKDANFYVNSQIKADNLLNLFYIGALKRSLIVAIVLIFGKKIFKYSDFCYFFNIYIFGLAIYLSTYLISPDIGVRMSSYFTIFDIVIAGNLIFVLKNRDTRILIITIFSLIAVYKLIGYMNDEYYIYHSFLTANNKFY